MTTQQTAATPPAEIDYRALRDELNLLNMSLRKHNDGEEQLPDELYRKNLRRSIDIVTLLNTSFTPPKEKKKASPATSRLAQLKANPNSLDDL